MTVTITIHPDMTATVETADTICTLPPYHPSELRPWQSEDELRGYAKAIAGDTRFMLPKPVVTVADRKAQLTADINAERNRRIDAPFTFSGVVFQADPISRERIDRARISALGAITGGAQPGNLRWHGEPVDFAWIAADDSRVSMDAQTVFMFGSRLAAREGLLVVHANDLKLLVAAAEDDAELDAIDITSGWPA